MKICCLVLTVKLTSTNILKISNNLLSFCVHRCFVCMCVYVRVWDFLELELQMVLEFEPQASVRAASTLNLCEPSLQPRQRNI